MMDELNPEVRGYLDAAKKAIKAHFAALGEESTGDEFAEMERLAAISSTPIPAPLAALKEKTVHHTAVCDIAEMPAYVRGKTEETL